jgi:competence protein ComEA
VAGARRDVPGGPTVPAVLFSSRRADDADVIRARLRALLDEGGARRGWVPDDADPGPGSGPAQSWGLDDDPRDDPADDLDEDIDGDPDSWSVDPADAVTTPLPATDDGEAGAPAGRHRASGPATRVDPGPHGARTLWVVAVLAALAVAGWSWLGRPDVAPVDAAPVNAPAVPVASTGPPTSASPTSAPAAVLVVSVVGQVVSPGLVTLPAGSRVADALAAVGGLLPEADPASVNAAALLTDGQQVAVGVPGAAGGTGTGAGTAAGGGAGSGPVDLNSATAADLDALPGIGPVLAQRILDHREEQGPFGRVEELDDVSGIGPALYAEISPLVTV